MTFEKPTLVLLLNIDLQANTQTADQPDYEINIQRYTETLQHRLQQINITDVIIQSEGNTHFVLFIPGVDENNQTAVIEQLNTPTYTLGFHQAYSNYDSYAINILNGCTPIPQDMQILTDDDGEPTLIRREVLLTQEHVADIQIQEDYFGQALHLVIDVKMNAQGTRLLRQITRQYIGQRLAIVLTDNTTLNQQVVFVPYIRDYIGNGRVTLSSDPDEHLSHIAPMLSASVPIPPMVIINQYRIGPKDTASPDQL